MSGIPGKARIKDIAILAGVSEGTVDRVLHNRGNVSEKSRKKIEAALEQIDYKPNIFASVLAQKRNVRIIAIVPAFSEGDYWEMVANGIKHASDEVSMLNVSIQLLKFDQFDIDSCHDVFEQTLSAKPDGVVFPPFFREESELFIQELNSLSIPYVFLDSIVADTNVLTYYGQDSFQSGAIAAKLMMSLVGEDSSIAMFQLLRKGSIRSNQTLTRKRGFLSYIQENSKGCKPYPIELDPAHPELDIKNIAEQLIAHPATKGAIIFNSLSYLVIEYLKKLGRSDIKVIGYDILDRNKKCLKEDSIQYLLAQQPEKQGYLGVKTLSDFLLFNHKPKQINYMPIDILIKENVDYV